MYLDTYSLLIITDLITTVKSKRLRLFSNNEQQQLQKPSQYLLKKRMELEPYRNDIGDIEETQKGISDELKWRDEAAERRQGGVAVDERRGYDQTAVFE